MPWRVPTYTSPRSQPPTAAAAPRHAKRAVFGGGGRKKDVIEECFDKMRSRQPEVRHVWQQRLEEAVKTQMKDSTEGFLMVPGDPLAAVLAIEILLEIEAAPIQPLSARSPCTCQCFTFHTQVSEMQLTQFGNYL
eukprot:gene5354-5381_t